MQQRIDATYEDFVARVAAGRGLSTEAVDEIAQGRVWAGGDAMGIGLVDEFGGLTDAIQYAATMAGLDSYRLVEYPAVEPMYTKLLSSMNQPANDQDITAGLPGAFVRTGNWLLGIHSPEMAAQMQPIEIILK